MGLSGDTIPRGNCRTGACLRGRKGCIVDIGRALTFAFRDPRWATKLGLAVLFGLPAAAMELLAVTWLARYAAFPVQAALLALVAALASVPVFGFALGVARGAAKRSDLPMPDWADLGNIVRDGLKAWGVETLWILLGLVVTGTVAVVGGAVPRFAGALVLLATLARLALAVTRPAALGRLAVTGSLAAGLDIGAALTALPRNPGGYFLAFLASGLAQPAATVLGIAVVLLASQGGEGASDLPKAIVLGAVLARAVVGPYVQFALFHLYGQAIRPVVSVDSLV